MCIHIYLSIYLPIYLSTYLSIYLSIFLSIYLSIYISIYCHADAYDFFCSALEATPTETKQRTTRASQEFVEAAKVLLLKFNAMQRTA